MKKLFILLLLLSPSLCFAQDKVRVQVLTDGDAFYYPKDNYCSDEQAAQVLAIVGANTQKVEADKVERVEARRIAAEIEAAKPVKEVSREQLEAEKASLEAQKAELDARIVSVSESVLTAKPQAVIDAAIEEVVSETPVEIIK